MYASASLAAISAATCPAKPTVVVQNMPGAGSLRAVNYALTMWRRATARRSRTSPATCRSSACSAATPTRSSIHAALSGSALITLRQRRLHSDRAHRRAGQDHRGGAPAGGGHLVLGGTAEGATGNDVPIILRDTIGAQRQARRRLS